MSSLTPLFIDPKLWVAALALIVASVSAFVSWRSFRNSSFALAISQRQEERRSPQLSIYFVNGYRRLVKSRQTFGFLISVSNPTDINNSVARAELQVGCVFEHGVEALLRIQHAPQFGRDFVNEDTESTVFQLPLRIDAHQTLSGWFIFSLENSAIGTGTIDTHTLILEDTHGTVTTSDSIMVRAWSDESNQG